MRQTKWLIPFLLVLLTIFLLSGCVELPEKPTGLDDAENEQVSEDTDINTEEKHATSNIETESDEEKTSKENDKDSDQQKSEEHSKDQTSKMDKKESKSDKGSEKKSDDSSKGNGNKNKSKEKPEKKSEQKTDSSTESAKKDNSKNNKKSNEEEKEDKSNPAKGKKQGKQKTSEDSSPKIVHSIVISSDEVPLPETELEIEEGDTVLDALISITMKYEIHMDYRGGQGGTAYVQGMGNVYEFDRGSGSGWMYSVNGIFPDRGAGVVPLKDGDRVEWVYTTNLGEDLNADLQPFRR